MSTSPTEHYTLSLHDALPISHYQWRAYSELARPANAAALRPAFSGRLDLPHGRARGVAEHPQRRSGRAVGNAQRAEEPAADRKSTRLNSSHSSISYAVFCLKK